MILLAESGSTKCDWMILSEDGIIQRQWKSKGLNPSLLPREDLAEEIHAMCLSHEIDRNFRQIFFFGAGCSGTSQNRRLQAALKENFSSATVVVQDDLMAAALATYTGTPAIICILGTGSNAALYDGSSLVKGRPSLGYLLGDEGAGVSLGRNVLRSFFYELLPSDMQMAFSKEYPELTREVVLEHLYRRQHPNAYLASFVPFLVRFRKKELVQSWLLGGFTEFLEIHLAPFAENKVLPIHFVGSIASIFEEEIRMVCQMHGYQAGQIVQKPMKALAQAIISDLNT